MTSIDPALLVRNALLPSVDASADLERSRLGTLRLRIRPVPMTSILDQCVESVGPFISARHQSLNVTKEGPAMLVEADPSKLGQVLRHLVVNAAMFSAENAVIRIHVSRHPGEAVICVSDSGIGIESSRIEAIFGSYAERHVANAARRGGLGIGLHVARAIMHAHAGSLVAASEGAGRGSSFTLRVPGRSATDAVAPTARATRPVSAVALPV